MDLGLAMISLAVLSILITSHFRRRKRKSPLSPGTCYLQSQHHYSGKPQFAFKSVLADNSFSPFKHFAKLNRIHSDDQENGSNLHPYEAEITTLIQNPALEFEFEGCAKTDLKMRDSYVWVETESQLRDLADALSQERVFAVDTEQHSLRSFLGFTALIQICTKIKDYLVDTIALHDAMGVLGPVFANPAICKVFHGADNDVLWLQRDFHIYVVNLFDTAKACEMLSKPQKSLAYLLETYCSIATDKLLQREDWRQRPLSAEMLQYARTDAYYLLYIADCLFAELKQHDTDNDSCLDGKLHFVPETSRRSNTICLQLYTKEIEVFPGESAASSIISRYLIDRSRSSISCDTQELVRRLCTWREIMARVHDDSLRYVLSDQAIVCLATKVPSVPSEIHDIVAQADQNLEPMNVNTSILSPSLVICSHLEDFYNLIHHKESNLSDIFPALLQKCLGPNGSCQLSLSNYTLLVNCDLRQWNKLVSKQIASKIPKQATRKASRELFVQKFSCKSPVYHNCRIFANDGRLLCYCDQKKLEWYLRRDLAKLVDDNPLSIMLMFEPKGRPEDEDKDFYIQSKKNICVGCGEGSHYLRYRIIPSCYRMHFPEHLKSHRSHDIVLLCVDCHEIAHAVAEKHKKQIAADFGIPLFVYKVFNSKEASVVPRSSSLDIDVVKTGVSPLQLRTAAMALLRHGPKMPPQRYEELTQIVMQFYGGREVSQEDLETALLVGMSPHERRRFEKKRGLSLKLSSARSRGNKKENAVCTVTKGATENKFGVDDLGHLGKDKAELSSRISDQDDCSFTDTGIIDEFSFSVNTCKTMNLDECEVSGVRNVFNENATHCEKSSENGSVDPHCSREDDTILPNLKVSLLGHGPHGKQVVDYILKEYGEDGIQQFCQRWRQVFVEAIHPRFLPSGWNVMHRYSNSVIHYYRDNNMLIKGSNLFRLD
ncbi:hypothetical protein K2173_003589 [Erythroxylum novogranatense]|uniref:HRDC domain-containing protein n=1 Tax=Erythroxylum novogranatense TaxID=1862640 RepID=A0AAV8TAG5_9ROSI|nr:hypothetical protein K2173_003589 [Erythroxylum novogranatense]